MARQYIKLVFVRDHGDGSSRAEASIKDPNVTPLMLDVAEELLYVMSFGERPTKRKAKKKRRK